MKQMYNKWMKQTIFFFIYSFKTMEYINSNIFNMRKNPKQLITFQSYKNIYLFKTFVIVRIIFGVILNKFLHRFVFLTHNQYSLLCIDVVFAYFLMCAPRFKKLQTSLTKMFQKTTIMMAVCFKHGMY